MIDNSKHVSVILIVYPKFLMPDMTILDAIIANKHHEVAQAKAQISSKGLEKELYFQRKTISLKERLSTVTTSGIIAEFKRKSPSKGVINNQVSVQEITKGYADAGATGLSILTDFQFFGGSKQDLLQARDVNELTPILRKDFIIDQYQLMEAKAWGADVVLLIAANLLPKQIENLGREAHHLGLEVLLEVHNKAELEQSLCSFVDIVGVNNRNLKNFSENNVNASLELIEFIPSQFAKVSESCISTTETVKCLQKFGYQGFLIGENFMKTVNPAESLAKFVKELSKI